MVHWTLYVPPEIPPEDRDQIEEIRTKIIQNRELWSARIRNYDCEGAISIFYDHQVLRIGVGLADPETGERVVTLLEGVEPQFLVHRIADHWANLYWRLHNSPNGVACPLLSDPIRKD